jgi:hypothetical protein
VQAHATPSIIIAKIAAIWYTFAHIGFPKRLAQDAVAAAPGLPFGGVRWGTSAEQTDAACTGFVRGKVKSRVFVPVIFRKACGCPKTETA